MVIETRDERRERCQVRILTRSVLYRILSQALSYPSAEALTQLNADLGEMADIDEELAPQIAAHIASLGKHVESIDVPTLQAEHRRVFSHILSADCPPSETPYTSRDIFQETEALSDIAGFFRAFGLELAEKERMDHISVEMEFMHFLTYKEAYALEHHGPAKARLCRVVQRKFMQDHLGRWAPKFAHQLDKKAGGGYFSNVAALTETFVSAEIDLLRARPEALSAGPEVQSIPLESVDCPVADECPAAG